MMQYEGWSNPYAANMGDLIARSGDAAAHAAEMTAQAQARAAEIRGQAWAGAVQNIAQIPAQISASRSADTDRKLKEEALRQTIGQREDAKRQQIVKTIGRLANGSKSPDDFVSGLGDMVGLGGLPKDIAGHIAQQVQAAGPDGWEAVKGKYIEFGDQFEQAVKLGKDETLVKPGSGAVVASGTPGTTVLRPGDVAVQPTAAGQPARPIASAPFAPGTGQHVVNGQVLDAAGQAIGAQVPKQEGASEVELNNARIDQINKGIEEIDNKIAGTMGMSEKDRAELAIQRQRLVIESRNADRALAAQDINSPKNQERLEESYRGLLKTTQSSRSGGMGLEDKKVDQARHLITLMEQRKDPKTGQYSLTPQQQSELAIGLATLISPQGAPAEGTIKSINQATLEGDLAKALNYATGQTVGGTPQKLAELLRDSIERQGIQAEQNREGHFNQLRAFAPTDLSADRRSRLEQGLIGANRLSVEVDGYRFPTQRAADEYQKAKAKQ